MVSFLVSRFSSCLLSSSCLVMEFCGYSMTGTRISYLHPLRKPIKCTHTFQKGK